MFESVLLPAPFSPRSACTSPLAASKSTESFATTPGNLFVIWRSETAGIGVSGESAGVTAPPVGNPALALCAADDSAYEPVDRVELLNRQPLPFRDAELAALVVQRPGEHGEGSVAQRLLLVGNECLCLGGDF